MRGVFLLLAALAVVLPGCAFTAEENRPLTTALDDAVRPESTGAKIALAPVFGFVLLGFTHHPLYV